MLRDYQAALVSDVYKAWAGGAVNVCMVLPTGGGKTKTLSNIIHNYSNPSAVVAHRQELVGQLSTALADEGVYHRIIAPQPVINFCIGRHIKKTGRSFHHAQAPCACGGVRTVLTRAESLSQFYSQVGLQIHDEAHHVLRENEWGRAAALFERAYGLFPTATPLRADRKSLGRMRSGIMDALVIGPSMHDLINRGYLTKYRVFGLPASIDLEAVEISDTTGDYNQTQLRREAHKSQIVGDVVGSYLAHIPGKRAICFAVDVEQANEISGRFLAAGVRSAAVSAKTPDLIRQDLVDKFSEGHIDVLVNVDLFGEGFDVPGCEAVIMARPTMSYGLFVQQFGRCLRPSPGKTHGFILDHVNNITRHGPRFFRPQRWSLDDEERGRRKRDPDEIPITTCTKCFWPYERVTRACPNCGHIEEPAGRGSPEFVDGDLTEFSDELLAALRGEQQRIDGPVYLPATIADQSPAGTAIKRAHAARQAAQAELREAMAAWAGVQKYSHDRTDSEIYRRFYFRFSVDMQTAVTLGTAEASVLLNTIRESLS